MPEVPEARQSIRPDRGIVIGLVAVLVVMAVVWFAVSAAMGSGGQDCPAKARNTAESRCR
jgi:hypothetical protein